ncbi:2-heptaprenyl-1,4-naphthoquinone methyltransferase [Phytophthora megakarya]|uniref:2-heptaprenyl-1,4-naphthoquinone methyltransferase n=1 Tax=Phytophthora megakarya TaxID=4795 RepID=A0A225WV97_9STRA|nr:2-heptaprenyl-1,4-naphthoquinone methyltransferase [Phytophthora megakarya]
MEKVFTNANWSAHAKTYNSIFSKLTGRWATDSLQVAHHEIQKKLQQHEAKNSTFHFLDVGCGPGVLSFEFARRYLTAPTDIRITASDLSDGMLQLVSDALKDDSTLSPFAPKFTTLQCDGMVLEEVTDNSVDAIGSNFGLGIFPNRAKGWATAHRVLKEDGLLFVTAWSDKSSQMVWLDTITDMFNAAEGEGTLKYPSLGFGTDREKTIKELQAVGFKDVKSYCSTHTIVFENPKAFLAANMSLPTTAKFLEKLTKEQMERTLVELIEKDAQQNFYQEGDILKSDSANPFAEGGPRLISFTGFIMTARK